MINDVDQHHRAEHKFAQQVGTFFPSRASLKEQKGFIGSLLLLAAEIGFNSQQLTA
jgi:hypothetical protein